MAKKKTTSKRTPSAPFEQSLEELKQIVGELENGNLTLSDSLEKYEQGVGHLKQCFETLNQAQRKIEMLVDLDEDGNLITRPFDDSASVQASDGVRRSTQLDEADIEDDDADTEDDEFDTEGDNADTEDDEFDEEESEDIDDPDRLF